MRREHGSCVRWGKTFGTLDTDRGPLFVHYQQIDSDGFRRLYEGQRVTFERSEDQQGRPCAINVRPIDEIEEGFGNR